MLEFAPICIYLVISLLVSLIPLGLPFPFSSNSSTYPEKLSAYECGFDPFGDARSRFDIRFYLVSILFIILDPEVTFFFPWAVPLNKIDPICWEFRIEEEADQNMVQKNPNRYEWKMPLKLLESQVDFDVTQRSEPALKGGLPVRARRERHTRHQSNLKNSDSTISVSLTGVSSPLGNP
ncbi:hypothetical protein Cgig2_010059 [Carnegiea gigantea]|uniref:NADH-ubiquinone oxidoreductase chain 3 n=1 Tax=Carnegiea gigantea TaxID=171969 RepID=A0A9Q1K335_9CARY|nr:hypothetical protein Cgig2_021463 [Carnegiea gigantea]KAJ8435512.1 hypothetical protein Cgig2_010059 [Carnegiea gigantea]